MKVNFPSYLSALLGCDGTVEAGYERSGGICILQADLMNCSVSPLGKCCDILTGVFL